MYKLNLITVVSIVAAVSLVVGMASPLAFAAQHASMNTTDNMGLMGNNMTGGNATAGNMTETESVTTTNETGFPSGDDESGCDTIPCSIR